LGLGLEQEEHEEEGMEGGVDVDGGVGVGGEVRGVYGDYDDGVARDDDAGTQQPNRVARGAGADADPLGAGGADELVSIPADDDVPAWMRARGDYDDDVLDDDALASAAPRADAYGEEERDAGDEGQAHATLDQDADLAVQAQDEDVADYAHADPDEMPLPAFGLLPPLPLPSASRVHYEQADEQDREKRESGMEGDEDTDPAEMPLPVFALPPPSSLRISTSAPLLLPLRAEHTREATSATEHAPLLAPPAREQDLGSPATPEPPPAATLPASLSHATVSASAQDHNVHSEESDAEEEETDLGLALVLSGPA
jgi:hypothetical protein